MRSVVALIALLVGACGGGGGAPAGTPTCGDGEVAWTGASDGRFTDPLAYTFVNKLGANDGRLEINFADGRFLLEWQLLTQNGGESPAQVVIDRSASGGASFGTCLSTGIYPGTIHLDDSRHGWFAFGGNLASGPDGCGTPIDGDLLGCFQGEPEDPR